MMRAKHYAILAGCLVGIGTAGQAVDHWTIDAVIKFIFGAIAIVGTQLGAIYMQRPIPRGLRRREE
jgi:hypothetical protein